MMLTKQTARKSTGGKAPRKSIGGKGVGLSNSYSSDTPRHQVNFTELMAKYMNRDRHDHVDFKNPEDVTKFINDQYENCDELVKKWIYDDLIDNYKVEERASDNDDDMIDSSLLQKLDDNTKFEILQFIPTFTHKVEGHSKLERSKPEVKLDYELITFHKMRLISKYFNKLMKKKILSLRSLTVVTKSNTRLYLSLLSAAQNNYKESMITDPNYDLDIDNVTLYNSQTPPDNNNEAMTFGGGFSFSSPAASFNFAQSTSSTTFSFSQYTQPKSQNTNDQQSNTMSESVEYTLVEKLFEKQERKKNIHKVDVDYLHDELHMYSGASSAITNFGDSIGYPPFFNNIINSTVETLTLIVDDQYLSKVIVEHFSGLKKLNLLYCQQLNSFENNFEISSQSLEEVVVCATNSLELIHQQPYLLHSFVGTSCPNMKSITFSPLMPYNGFNVPTSINDCFSQVQGATDLNICKLNIYNKTGRCESELIKTDFFTTITPTQRELNIYCVQYKSLLEIEILEELYEKFGKFFLKFVMPSMILGYNCPSSFDNEPSLWKDHFVDALKRFKDTANYFFKKRFPISHILLSSSHLLRYFGVTNYLEANIKDAKLRYLVYLCNQYQDSKLLVDYFEGVLILNVTTIIAAIHGGWDFTKQINDLLELFIRNGLERETAALLNTFDFDQQFLVDLLDYLISRPSLSRHMTTEIMAHLSKKNPQLLNSTLTKPIDMTANRNEVVRFTIPFIALLFGKVDNYLISKLLIEMDLETFNSIGQNNRGDNILHIYVYLQLHNFDNFIFFSILNKNPNLIHMVNHKLQTPLHYMMLNSGIRSPLLLPEINRILKSNNLPLLDMNMTDYMESSPLKILKSEEYDRENIIYDFKEEIL